MIRELEAEFKPRMHKALRFDGVDDYVEIPSSDSLNCKYGVTLEGWAYLQEYKTGVITGDKEFLYRWIHIKEKGRYWWHIGDGKDWFFRRVENWSVPLKQWFHLACVVNWVEGWGKIYLNGSLKSEATFTPLQPKENSSKLIIGGWSRLGIMPGISGFWPGEVAIFRIYSRVLSESEILWLYHNPFDPLDLDSLVLWLAPASIDVANGKWWDLSKYKNHGTIYGATEVNLVKEVAVL